MVRKGLIEAEKAKLWRELPEFVGFARFDDGREFGFARFDDGRE
jgi:hypothetical protein